MVYYFTRESNSYMSRSGLPRLFPAPWQRPCSGLEPTSMYGCMMATRQGFPGTQHGVPSPTHCSETACQASSSAYLVFSEESFGHSHRGCENTF